VYFDAFRTLHQVFLAKRSELEISPDHDHCHGARYRYPIVTPQVLAHFVLSKAISILPKLSNAFTDSLTELAPAIPANHDRWMRAFDIQNVPKFKPNALQHKVRNEFSAVDSVIDETK